MYTSSKRLYKGTGAQRITSGSRQSVITPAFISLSCKDLSAFFNQYLRDTRIPTLEYKMDDGKLQYRYTNIVDDFDMPIEATIDGTLQWLFPTNNWQTLTVNGTYFEVKRDYYINVTKV